MDSLLGSFARLALNKAASPTLFRPATQFQRAFSSSPISAATYNQVLRGCRVPQPARKKVSPGVENRSFLKGVCLRVTTMSPKKPNSASRKVARVKLSTDRVIWAYIPGEGHNVQQHSVVLVRGGRSQDLPGVRYHLVRGAGDLVSDGSLDGAGGWG
jgi:small subunit ribosomal protein S12